MIKILWKSAIIKIVSSSLVSAKFVAKYRPGWR